MLWSPSPSNKMTEVKRARPESELRERKKESVKVMYSKQGNAFSHTLYTLR